MELNNVEDLIRDIRQGAGVDFVRDGVLTIPNLRSADWSYLCNLVVKQRK